MTGVLYAVCCILATACFVAIWRASRPGLMFPAQPEPDPEPHQLAITSARRPLAIEPRGNQ